ncbi:chaperonin 10-like protein [Coniella lustricola]|uniref:Chaperonin 10-like protein n=1 Tax=Coniella lustricola TaxID=2025994 RepID=A0A2T3A4F5_9PEZI|nr:chaperonin 10-like protein [Coniella lustricola]
MTANQAAWLDAKGKRLEVRDANMPIPGPDEMIVRNHAVAVNPVDWKMQDGSLLDYVGLPFILGCDAAGVVVEIGNAVVGFKKGDRVMIHCISLCTVKSQSGAFQTFSAANFHMASKIPKFLSFTDATVLPLAISTAADGLYAHNKLGLPLPLHSSNTITATPSKQSVFIWGGSSSVGAVAIQLAKASGLAVITTASAHNLASVKSDLGADYAFDYTKAPERTVENIANAVSELKAKGYDFGGVFDAISLPSTFAVIEHLFDALDASNLLMVVDEEREANMEQKKPKKVKKLAVVSGPIWGEFVLRALEKGSLRAFPRAEVLGRGLKFIQEGIDKSKEGVSYRKIVIEI